MTGLALTALAVRCVWADRRAIAVDLSRTPDLHGAAFAGSAACARCHAEHARSWRRSFHRTMTQEATDAAVVGDFANASYRYLGVTARMRRDEQGRYLMSFAPGDGGPELTAIVTRTVGSRRYQQYLAEADGALWRLPLAYHIEERRWFPMNGAFLTPDPDDERRADEGAGPQRPRFAGGAFDRHVTRWNDNCVFCHNVAPNPGRAPESGTFHTTVAELGVACEACHGPGAAHVRANQDPLRRYTLHETGAADPTIVNPSRLSPARSADVCGRCHGQRIADDVAPFLAHGDPFVPGDDLGLYSSPLWRDTPRQGERDAFSSRFWPDGTPRLTAYEYQGLLESPCAQRGALTCTSCHGMHDGDPRGQLRPAAAGDRACTGCHQALGAPAAVAAHTRHDPSGPGARCIACHMPRIVYGVLDVHVSHRIEVPDPRRAAAMGRPDACTLCHVDADRAWAIREAERLWPGRRSGAAARPGEEHGAPKDAVFAGDPIARAVAADALGRAPAAVPGPGTDSPRAASLARADVLVEAMAGDRYPAVRHLAARALTRVLADRGAVAALAAGFDATADEAERARILRLIGQALRGPATAGRLEGARLAALRAESVRADIDIGE